jgi:DNA-binding NtrC family response regulator
METKARVLVVDDEERFRKTLIRLLRESGFQVDGAPDGLAALEKLGDGDFDVVLLDMKMPGLSGEETLQKILEQNHDVEIICLTGHVSAEDVIKNIRHGAFDYLLKPASIPEILKAVQQALKRKLLRNGQIGIHDLLTSPGD